jgi:hypothetical protein
MTQHQLRRALTAGAICATQLVAAPTHALSSPTMLARFEGQTIDLAQGWGAARACSVDTAAVTCYRSEQAMNQALMTAAGAQSQIAPATATAVCSTALRLYNGTSFVAPVLNITTRGALVSLSPLGFDNLTSSYKVGGCAATLYSGIQTGAYGGNSAANAQAVSMLSGWDNTISSVFIP